MFTHQREAISFSYKTRRSTQGSFLPEFTVVPARIHSILWLRSDRAAILLFPLQERCERLSNGRSNQWWKRRVRVRAGCVSAFLILLAGSSFFSSSQVSSAQQAWSLPSPWSAQDIGSPAVAGSATFDQGTFTINASGADIGGRSDQFTFVYQQVTGDVDVLARVDSVSAASMWSKSGVMIRSSLAANAAHAFALVSAGRGVDFQRRANVGGMTSSTNGPSATAPYWVRLVRNGTTVTAYSSGNGTSWSVIASRSIALGATAYVGIATTSRNSSTPTTAVVSQASIVPLSLPAPQQSVDIGAPAIKGSASYRLGAYTIHAGGADIGGTSDQFQFVYQPMAGDGEVVARVQSLTNTSSSAKTGVMIRETLAADSRHAFASLSAGDGYAFQRRIDPAGVSQNTFGASGAAPGWVRLVRTGSRFDAYRSADGTNWTLIGSDAVPMTDSVYVGIATTSHNTSAATDAVLDNFKVTQGATSNQPPNVSITSPTDGSMFTGGKDITVTAAANDTDGTIARVDFFRGSTSLGSDVSAPYSVTWTAVPAGTYSLTAVAVDNDGASTTSSAVSIRVDPAANQPPTVTLTAPANGASYTTPATVSLRRDSRRLRWQHRAGRILCRHDGGEFRCDRAVCVHLVASRGNVCDQSDRLRQQWREHVVRDGDDYRRRRQHTADGDVDRTSQRRDFHRAGERDAERLGERHRRHHLEGRVL